jgi:RNA polymerase sigma factor (TIGR02999 family)
MIESAVEPSADGSWGSGEHVALGTTTYSELMIIARSQLGRGNTLSLDAPSIVHEAYLRLAHRGFLKTMERGKFYAYASRVMRAVIIDYLRERRALKRGGDDVAVTLTTGIPGLDLDGDGVEHLHSALSALARIDDRSHRVVEMRYFAGLSEQEIADALEVSVPTVKRDWRKARAFLFEAMESPT